MGGSVASRPGPGDVGGSVARRSVPGDVGWSAARRLVPGDVGWSAARRLVPGDVGWSAAWLGSIGVAAIGWPVAAWDGIDCPRVTIGWPAAGAMDVADGGCPPTGAEVAAAIGCAVDPRGCARVA